MTNLQYIRRVLATESINIPQIISRLTERRTIRLLHSAIGLVTEAAEYLDALKKYIFYGKELDITNLTEELGDISWYQGISIDELSTSLEDIQIINIAKLQQRYGIEFDNDKAIKRDLDAERYVLEKRDRKSGE